MRKTKRFAAAVAALAMAVSMVAASSTMTAFAADTYSITISKQDSDKAIHTFAYAPIFTGSVNASGVIADPVLNTAINKATLVEKLKTGFTNVAEIQALKSDSADTAICEALSKISDADKLAQILKGLVTPTDLTAETRVPGGYYLIVDKVGSPSADSAADNSGAKSAFMLKLVKNTDLSTVAKASAPTVDKQVFDNDDKVNTGDNNGWGETADHNVNQAIKFRLVASIPNEEGIEKYTNYTLKFNDTLGAGLVFDSITSVKFGNDADSADTPIPATKYTTNAEANKTGAWSLEITDLLSADTENIKSIKGKVVVVEYTAHLDPAACQVAGDSDDFNENKVNLEYSSNPNYHGTGTFGDTVNEETNETGSTPDDKVFVYTYKVDNVKVEAGTDKKLNNAVFQVKKGNDVLKFTWNEAKQAYAYDPVNGTETITSTGTIDQEAAGIFSFYGLDAGTYTITEVSAPSSEYNKLTNSIEVEIKATHSEGENETPTLDLTASNNINNTVENTKGAVLPETGGIGTTMFYVGGGALAAVAGTVLIAKKRAKKED